MKKSIITLYIVLFITVLTLSIVLVSLLYKNYNQAAKTTITTTKETTTTTTTTKKTRKPFVGERKPINIYVFYGQECGYCHRLHQFLASLEADETMNYKFNIIDYEIWHDKENKELMNKVAEKLNHTISGVPFYIIGENPMEGYAYYYNEDIKEIINIAYEYQDEDVVTPVGIGNIKKYIIPEEANLED